MVDLDSERESESYKVLRINPLNLRKPKLIELETFFVEEDQI